MSTFLTTPARWPTSWLAVYWLVAVVLFEVITFSLIWHVGDWFVASGLGLIALMTLTPALLIAGAALMVVGIVAGLRSRSTPLRRLGIGLAPVLAVVIGIGLTAPLHQGIGVAMTWSTLLLNHARYSSIIDQVRRGEIVPPKDGKGSQDSTQGIKFEAERSGPRRTAFILPDHWLSDWQVILYDPSIRPSGAGRPDADIDREQASLFDGWLKPYECSRLSGPYLSCYLSSPGHRRGHG